MELKEKRNINQVFKLIDERKVGPLKTILFSLNNNDLSSIIQDVEAKHNLRVNGFRTGHCPVYRLYLTNQKVIEQEVKYLLHSHLKAEQHVSFQKALIPPELIVQGWNGKDQLIIEVRWLEHPGLPQPGERHQSLMGAGEMLGDIPGAPNTPEPGVRGREQVLPQVHLPSPTPGAANGMSFTVGSGPVKLELPNSVSPVAAGKSLPVIPQ